MKKKILTNIFASKEVFNEGFSVQLFEIKGCKAPKHAEKVAKWFSFKYYRIPASHFLKNGSHYMAIASDELFPNIIHCDEHHYKLELKEKDYKLFPHYKNDKLTVENIMYRVIESHNYRELKDNIWIRNKSQRVFCEKETELFGPETKVKLYPGYRVSIEYLPDKKIGLVLDSTTTLVDYNTLSNLLPKLSIEKFEEKYYGQYIIYTDEKGIMHPRYFVGIREGYNMDSFEVEYFGSNISLRKKFSNKNPITGKAFKGDERVAEIKYFEKYEGQSEFVPLGCLQYSPDLEDLKETHDIIIFSDEIYTNPQSKYEKILKYLTYYNEVEVGKYVSPIRLHFYEKDNKFELKELEFPLLKFGNDYTLKSIDWNVKKAWRYAKKNTLKEHGYYKNPILDKILIIYNSYFDKNIVELFREEFLKMLNEWKLDYEEKDIDIIPIENIQKLDEFVRHNREKDPEIICGAILIINNRIIKYDDLKDCLNKYQVPSQGIKEWNCNKNNFEREDLYHSILENTVAGLVGKCNGIPWIIDNKLSADFYIGLDSGGPKKQRSWSCAYVFDDHGEKIYQREAEYYAKEGLPDKIFKKLIIEAVEKKFLMTNNKIGNLIIHRDGFLPKEEMSGLELAIDELKLRERLKSSFCCLVVNMRKTSNFRILNEINGEIRNPLLGTYLILDENRAILTNTGFPVLSRSTAKPLLIEILNICGEYNIEDVINDIFYLSELNWGSPMTGFKMPITIYYAGKMIEFAHLKHKPTHLPV